MKGILFIASFAASVAYGDLTWNNSVDLGKWSGGSSWVGGIAPVFSNSVAITTRAQKTTYINAQDETLAVKTATFWVNQGTFVFGLTNSTLRLNGDYSLTTNAMNTAQAGFGIYGVTSTTADHVFLTHGTLDFGFTGLDIGYSPSYVYNTFDAVSPDACVLNPRFRIAYKSGGCCLTVSNGAQVVGARLWLGHYAAWDCTVRVANAGTVFRANEASVSGDFEIGSNAAATNCQLIVEDGAQLIFASNPNQTYTVKMGGVNTRMLIDNASVTNFGGYYAVNGQGARIEVRNNGRLFVDNCQYFNVGTDGGQCGNALIVDNSLCHRLNVLNNYSYGTTVGVSAGANSNRLVFVNNATFRTDRGDTNSLYCYTVVGCGGSFNELVISNSLFETPGMRLTVGYSTGAVSNRIVAHNGTIRTRWLEVNAGNRLTVSGTNTLIAAETITFGVGASLDFTVPAGGYAVPPIQSSGTLAFGGGPVTATVDPSAFRAAGGRRAVLMTNSVSAISYAQPINWVLPPGAKIDTSNPYCVTLTVEQGTVISIR